MYGLVNNAIRDLVISAAGESVWEQIKREAGVADLELDDTTNYNDQVSLDLVVTACEVLDLPMAALLEMFGRHWVLYTNREGWLHHFRMDGEDFIGCLRGLDEMHQRVQDAMPDARMPMFVVSESGDDFHLDYISTRSGFAPMVLGVVKALAEQFDEHWNIQLLACEQSGAAGDRFLLTQVTRSEEGNDDHTRAA